jgi:hypothetical protein
MVAMGKPSCAAGADGGVGEHIIAANCPRGFPGNSVAWLAAGDRADYRYARTPQTASQEGAIMTDPAPRRRTVTTRLLVLLAAAALVAGCELATGTVRTASELQDAGIRNPNLQYDNGVATLRYDADPNPLEARAEQDRAAAVIWRNLPFRIDRITVIADGGAFPNRRDYPRALLEQELGPRPANLDRSVADIARRATLIAVAVALVLMVLIVVVIVLVVRAVRRRPTPQPAGAWPQGGAPQPWGQPGWGQAPPPGQPPPPGQQPWGQPPPAQPQPWGQAPPPQPPPQPPPPSAPPPARPGAAGDWPTGAPRPEAPARGPGDTQRLEPGPPPPSPRPPEEDRGPAPPN